MQNPSQTIHNSKKFDASFGLKITNCGLTHTWQQGAYVAPHQFATSFQWCYICSSAYCQPSEYMHFVIECQHLHTTQLMKEPKQNSSKNTKNWSSQIFFVDEDLSHLDLLYIASSLTFWPQQLSEYIPMNVSLILRIVQH